MKNFILLLTVAFITSAAFAQDVSSVSYLEAFYDSSTGMISYRNYGDITKDGIKLIDLKTKALDNYIIKTNPGSIEMGAIEKEKAGLEKLRQRILLQRERMMQPMPPMQEMR